MTKFSIPLALVTVVVMTELGLQVWYWPQIPNRIATKFDGNGKPVGWMNKQAATAISVGMVTLLPVLFVGLSWMLQKLPLSLINIPHRDYWLAPERREESVRWMTAWLLWYTVILSIFLGAINHLTFIANSNEKPLQMSWFWGALGAFLFSTFVFVLMVIFRFRKPN